MPIFAWTDWSGNVRELQNTVERAVILARGGTLELDLPGGVKSIVAVKASPGKVIPETEWRAQEKANLEAALEAAEGKISGSGGAAEL